MNTDGALFNFDLFQVSPDPEDIPEWYKASLANALRVLAQKSQAALPGTGLCAIIEEAAARAYIHECYINDMYAVNPSRPIHSDSSSMYNGYAAALVNLVQLDRQPGLGGTLKAKIGDINARLKDILAVVWTHENDVGGLFNDPEMIRLLGNLASVF